MPKIQALNMSQMKHWIAGNRSQWLEEFYIFLRFPSISSELEYRQSMLDCSEWVIKTLNDLGFTTESWPTDGHPVIYAHDLSAGPDKPTLLIYNHYDVQPVDPLEEWLSPPFEPVMRNGEIYARGAQDNKGQCFYILLALKMLKDLTGTLPLNVKLCIEGEEEVASPGLSKLIPMKKDQLKADYLAIVDLCLKNATTPTLTLGIRGSLTLDVEVQGALTDLHSGYHGGVVPNPIHTLVSLLSSLRDANGHILLPGFYQNVKKMSDEELSLISFQFDEEEYFKQTGTHPTGGETEYTPSERAWIRPTLEINGIYGGYMGKGFKTVIPGKAYAKLSCRLVPDQDPQEVGQLIKTYLEEHAPRGIQVTVHLRPGGGRAFRINPQSSIVRALSQAFEEVFKVPCNLIYEGASIPVVPELAKSSGAETIMLGLGLLSDQIHAPNEHFGIDRLEKGILIMARAMQILGNKQF